MITLIGMGGPGLNSNHGLSDSLVASALKNPSSGSVSYTVTAQDLTGYLAAGSDGINHGNKYFFSHFPHVSTDFSCDRDRY